MALERRGDDVARSAVETLGAGRPTTTALEAAKERGPLRRSGRLKTLTLPPARYDEGEETEPPYDGLEETTEQNTLILGV